MDYSKYTTLKIYFQADGFIPFVGPIADRIKERARERLNLSDELSARANLDELLEAVVMSLTVFSEPELAMMFTLQDEYCEKCGNCCRICNPIVALKEELKKIADYLRLSYKKLKKVYKIFPKGRDHPGKFNIPAAPCPFLKKNLCNIYDVRPSVCRFYPLGWAMEGLFRGEGPRAPEKCVAIENLFVESATARIMVELVYRGDPELFEKITKLSAEEFGNIDDKPVAERMQFLIQEAREFDKSFKKQNS